MFQREQNIYLRLMSLLQIDMTQAVGIRPPVK